jgi:uncharacterized protein (TIGR00299 family) protein
LKILYLECGMGVAGDMLMAALYELIDDREAFINKMNAFGLARISAEPSTKCGILGTHIHVSIDDAEELPQDENIGHSHHHSHADGGHHSHSHADSGDHSHSHADGGIDDVHDVLFNRIEASHSHEGSHSSFSGVTRIIDGLDAPDSVKKNAVEAYRLIAQAESHVHGKPVEEIHFHEVGSRDAIADVLGVCLLMDMLKPDLVVSSPIHTGSGFVRCAHGILPVPAPAAAYILQGIPTYSGDIKGELCTPTGAALIKLFASSFSGMPRIATEKIGYGMGFKDFKAANCVRAFLGDSFEVSSGANGTVAELKCNLDDMTGEAIGRACQILMSEGARDAFTSPIQMKKDRPGILLTCICDEDKADRFASLMIRHTTTFGVRKAVCERYMLDRSFSNVETPAGIVRVKTGTGYGVSRCKPEYNDVVEAAEKSGLSFLEMEELARREFRLQSK